MTSVHLEVHSRVNDAIWNSFSDAYNKAHALYEQDKLEECVEQCSQILEEEASLPRFIRITTLILLALVVKEEEDFHAARTEAETLYSMSRSFHCIGADEEVDNSFNRLRASLDELKQMEIEEWGVAPEEIEERDNAALVQAQASAEDQIAYNDMVENDHPGALEVADDLALAASQSPEDKPVPKVQVSESAFTPFQPVMPSSESSGNAQLGSGSSSPLRKKESRTFRPSQQQYVPPPLRRKKEDKK